LYGFNVQLQHETVHMNAPAPEYSPRYGIQHPECVENPIFDLAIRNNWTGFHLAEHLQLRRTAIDFGNKPWFSAYREHTMGPFWSWERFGRTKTSLPDGRIIHIAGEHEDSYDPDFCIYNDVVIECPEERKFEIYLYPKKVFPPTDFHTATLVGSDIILIGSLGYRDMRHVGETQVMMFDTNTLTFKNIATSGDRPGWIWKHRSELIGKDKILVVGGKVETSEGSVDNKDLFELDLGSMQWSRREHGDLEIFSVSAKDYWRFKSPEFGSKNPERMSNPFWLEMAKRDWPPSRARLHFGDSAPPRPRAIVSPLPPPPDRLPEPGSKEFEQWISASNIELPKLDRRREDVVWTAKRRDPGRITVSDGRKFVVGGAIVNYGNEYADPWTYNDIVVTDGNGEVAIFAYPTSIFPQLWAWIPIAHGNSVLIFGNANQDHHPERRDRFVLLRLDTTNFAITPLPISSPAGFRLNFYPGCELRTSNSIVFPNSRMTDSDQMLGIAFDLDTMAWGEPFPHQSPSSTEAYD
jgi:hypothetical protein